VDTMENERSAGSSELSHGKLSDHLSDAAKDFSLAAGGPLYQFLLRVKLVKPPFDRAIWRVVVITSIAWAPLLLLTMLGGRITSGVPIPFLHDYEAQSRFLLALPLLIVAELIVHRGMRQLIRQFVDRQIIKPAELSRFEACIASALRLRNSVVAELCLLVFIASAEFLWAKNVLVIPTDTWYASMVGGISKPTPAGYWYVFVSLPIVQFLGLRWYYRLFIWGRLLWQIARLDLNLIPSHPDGSCGLGFMGQIVFTLAPFLMAHSVLLSGFIANRIIHAGARLPDYRIEIAVVAILVFLIALGPLCVFTPRLIQRRRAAVYSYGSLASAYVNEFDKKWIQGQRPADEPLIGSADIQSLADLANSFSVVEHIVPFPFGREALVSLTVLIALPLLPLLLTMFSAQELAARLLKVFI
jgi:hypothetical protein